MKKLLVCMLAFLMTSVVYADDEFPLRKSGKTVYDYADVLSDVTENKIENYSETVGDKLDIVVITTDENPEDIQQYAFDLFDSWNVGLYNEENGVLILYSVTDNDADTAGRQIEYEIVLSENVSETVTDEGVEEITKVANETMAYGINSGTLKIYETICENFDEVMYENMLINSSPVIVLGFFTLFICMYLAFIGMSNSAPSHPQEEVGNKTDETNEKAEIPEEDHEKKPETKKQPVRERTDAENLEFIKSFPGTETLCSLLKDISLKIEKDPDDIRHVGKLFSYYIPQLVYLMEKNPEEVKKHETVKLMEGACKKIIEDIEAEDLMEITAEINALEGLLKLEGFSFSKNSKKG